MDKKLSAFKEMIPLFEKVYKEGRSILVVAESVEGEALATLVKNHVSPAVAMEVCAVKAPGVQGNRRALLEDIAALTGATVISQELGLKLSSISVEHLGQSDKAVIGQYGSRIMGSGGGKRLENRVSELRSMVEKEHDQATKEHLQVRLASLSGGIAQILCGGRTELEIEERKYRVEDSLHATRVAMEKGIVPGGGIALLRAYEFLSALLSTDPDARRDPLGWKIAAEAMYVPFQRIAQNAGLYDAETVSTALAGKGDYGLDALTGKWGHLLEMGVVDPLSVVLVALRTAASVASLVLLTESLIVMPVGG
jgi:chaperonin GroEL